ncbi:MAG: nucleoside deaminase [Tannerella sp.]|jgi:tRNA(adenine34) deaminase|nr:nucleoside deaminase [Tannerella sp.]
MNGKEAVTGKINPFTDEYFMKQALAEARMAADEGEVPVGAVIVCNGRIIARAHNQTERLNDPTAHAEMLVITAATSVLGAKYLTDCALYVTVEPCVMCAGAIGWSQISTLVYGAPDEKRGFRQFAPRALHPKTVVKNGVMEEDCATEMKQFFQKKRN